jgi:hypothetical protein
MVARLEPQKKAKKTGLKCGNGEGVRQKKVTFLWGPARKSGGITPLLLSSHNPNPTDGSQKHSLSLPYHDKKIQYYSQPLKQWLYAGGPKLRDGN